MTYNSGVLLMSFGLFVNKYMKWHFDKVNSTFLMINFCTTQEHQLRIAKKKVLRVYISLGLEI